MADTVKISATCTKHDSPLSEESDMPELSLESGEFTADFSGCWCEDSPEDDPDGCEFTLKVALS